ncbi:MAG: DUF3078 domain-containing protein [Bacteroidales bacterium]|jgi:hypothetical protein|nr:DUF3078 domain-containing protein [Bacteroidales bacterium]
MNIFVTKIIQGINYMCDIFKSKFITTIVLIFLGYSTIRAQVSEVDSTEYEAIQDTIQMIIGDPGIGTIHVNDLLDSVKLEDSIKSINDFKDLQAKFDEYFLKKTLKSNKNDTLYQLINKINFFIKEDSLVVSDSVFKALKKLQYYIENRDISNELHFLSNHEVLKESEYADKKQLADTINDALQYVVNYLLKDSLNLTFRNSNNEKDFFYSEKGVADSIHIKLYDQRGEFVLLWIKKTPDNVFDLYFEDGVYLQKTKQRLAIQHEIKTNQADITLKQVKKINIILPLWTYTGSIDLNFSQSYLSDWAAGGENSLSALSILRYNIDLVYGKKIWDNDIEYKLGYLQAGEGPLQKNEDKFELNSKYGHAAFNNWYYSFLLNFKTQFLPGYDYPKDADPVPVSGIMSPATLVFSLGLDYKPSNKFTLLLSPLTSKFTIFTDTVSYDQTRFGIEKDKKSKQEIGAYVKLLSKTYLRKDILLENRVTLFTNYIDNPQNVDVDWEAILSFEFTEYFKFKLNTHIIYDDNIDIPVYKTINGVKTKVGVTKKLQWKEVFSVGFTYKIFH